MQPNSGALSASPISKIPLDVIREIFAHSLPSDPLRECQPNTIVAPILLCHICSWWRTVALAFPTLWSHLSYCLHPTVTEEEDPDGIAIKSLVISKKEIDFLRWWKKNHGAVAPFIRLGVKYPYDAAEGLPPPAKEMTFIWEYLSTAQYLDLDKFYWDEVEEEKIGFDHTILFLNLNTLVKLGNQGRYDSKHCFYRTQSFMGHAYTQASSALRRLSIRDDVQTMIFDIPNHWSALTHISLSNVTISLDFWNLFIRAVHDLQWGFFDIDTLTGVEELESSPSPPPHTLRHLYSLFLAVYNFEGDAESYQASLLLTGLSLPALHTLLLPSLRSYDFTTQSITADLYEMLAAAPGITTLVLNSSSLMSKEEWQGPIWSHAVHLQRLHVEHFFDPSFSNGSGKTEAAQRGYVIEHAFSDGGWFDLENPNCPVREVKIVDRSPSSPWRDIHLATDMVLTLRETMPLRSDLAVEFTTKSLGQQAAKMWREWGLRA